MAQQSSRFSMLKDEETSIDKLGATTKYVEALCNVITQTEPPYTIGILGPWGSGKSSLMLQMNEKLTSGSLSGDIYKTIWFIPWKYNSRDVLWNAFLQTILQDMAKEYKGLIVFDQWKQELKRFSHIAAQMAASEIGKGLPLIVAAGVGGGPPAAAATSVTIMARIWEKLISIRTKTDDTRLDFYRYVQDLEAKFADLVEKYLRKWQVKPKKNVNRKKLIIFVDDLDRCDPDQAITVLAALKLFLNKANCIFVIGIDKEIIARGIKLRYGEGLQMEGKEYLEKIIQLHFELPTPDFAQIREMVEREVKGLNYNDEIWDMIRIATKSNIRRVKKFVDTLRLVQELAAIDHGVSTEAIPVDLDLEDRKEPEAIHEPEKKLAYLVKLVLLQMFFPDFFSSIVAFRELIPLCQAVVYTSRAIAVPDQDTMESYAAAIRQFLDHKSLRLDWEWPDCSGCERGEIVEKVTSFREHLLDYHPLARQFYKILELRVFLEETYSTASLMDDELVDSLLMLIPPPGGGESQLLTEQIQQQWEQAYSKGTAQEEPFWKLRKSPKTEMYKSMMESFKDIEKT